MINVDEQKLQAEILNKAAKKIYVKRSYENNPQEYIRIKARKRN